MPTRIIITKLDVPSPSSLNAQQQQSSSSHHRRTPAAVRSTLQNDNNNDDNDDDDDDMGINDGRRDRIIVTQPSPNEQLVTQPSVLELDGLDGTTSSDIRSKPSSTTIQQQQQVYQSKQKRQRRSQLPTFRSSLLRELNVRSRNDDDYENHYNQNETIVGIPMTTTADSSSNNHNHPSNDNNLSSVFHETTNGRTTTTNQGMVINNMNSNNTNTNKNNNYNSKSNTNTNQNNNTDIRGSPRLLGYLFSMIASAVMLVSVVQFYRQKNNDDNIQQQQQQQQNQLLLQLLSAVPVDPSLSLSSNLTMYEMIAAVPLMNTTINTNATSISNTTIPIDNDKYYYFFNGVVYRWKLWGAIFVSCIGTGLSLFTIFIHFDTIIAPELWYQYLQNGSMIEQYWILFLILFWSAAIHLCTSTLSVGESQANVYFATWIAFGSTVMNYMVWYESADNYTSQFLSFLQYHTTTTTTTSNTKHDKKKNSTSIRHHHNHCPSPNSSLQTGTLHADQHDNDTNNHDNHQHPIYRETTYNWLWVGFFSCIFAGAATDIYWNRHNVTLRFRGTTFNLHRKDWIIILSVVWSEVALCGIAITCNHILSNLQVLSFRLPQFTIRMDNNNNNNDQNTDPIQRYRFVFGWRQIEGLVILLTTALKFWVILRYAAVDGVISGLSNAYFGVWGSFFNGVFCFGTWLRENKNIEYIVPVIRQ